MLPSDDTLLRDRYRIVSLLGHGGMGAVHLAYDTALDIQVAVKSNRNPEASSQEQFLREARLLATLRHPNLPRVIDHFIVGDIQYLVMDYIPGKDLETLLAEDGIPPLDRVVDWTRQLVSALTYLHSQNPPVIHRDIKPANVKITPDGQAILVDFGLAKATDPSQATAAGATGYTPGYAPPEQYGGSHTGPYSDQYSLAATLYKLLTNQKPVESIKRLLGEAVLTPMQGLNPSVPAYIQNAIEKAMSLQPQDRFASTQEFQAALSNSNFQTIPTRTISNADHTVVHSYNNVPINQPSSSTNQATPNNSSKKKIVFTCLIASIIVIFLGISAIGIWYFGFRDKDKQVVAVNEPISSQEITATPSIPVIDSTSTDLPNPEPSSTNTMQMIENETPTATPLPTETTGPTDTPTPRYLVDENRIAFVSDRADGSTLQIWSMQIGQTYDNQIIAIDPQQLTFDEGDKGEPEWSPDGKKILYTAPGTSKSGTQIWILNLAAQGDVTRELTDLDGDNFNPTWSADGSRIAFTNYGRYNEVYTIYMIDANGRNLQRLSLDFQESDPKWTPDMEWLFYILHGNNHQYFYWRNKLDDYATPVPYDNSSHFGRMGEVDDPAFTADGSYLAYTRLDNNSKQIWSVDFSSRGASILLLTDGNYQEYQPSWSPDGQWIVFTSERNGISEIYVMTSVGLLQTNLTQSPGRDLQPDWFKTP